MSRFSESYGGTPLESIDLVSAEIRERLMALSITTAEELLSNVRAAPEATARFLEDLDIAQLEADIGLEVGRAFSAWVGPDELFRSHQFALGAVPPPDVQPEWTASRETFDAMVADLAGGATSAIGGRSLIGGFGDVKHQGRRGTCVAFAGCAVMEYLWTAAGKGPEDLSEQFLFHSAKMQDGHPNEDGTRVEVALPTLINPGVCTEDLWRYNPIVIFHTKHHGPPPQEAVDGAPEQRAAQVVRLDPRDSAGIRASIDNSQPVALAVPVYENWWGAVTKAIGKIPMPVPTAALTGGHAMCVVGYEEDEDFTGGGFFVMRNSWGSDWAASSPIAPGYGALPFEYVDRYGWEALTLEI